MSKITRRHALRAVTTGLTVSLIHSAAGRGSEAEKLEPKVQDDDRAAKLIDTMEGFRTKVPPSANDPNEQEGMAVGDYVAPHLRGVGRRMGIKTRAECMVLLTYLKDENVVVRYIAKCAVSDFLKAFPTGLNIDAVLKTQSKDHLAMVLHLVKLINKLPA